MNKPFKPRGSTKVKIEKLLTQIDPLSGISCGMKTYSGQESNQIKTNMDRMIRVKGKVFFNSYNLYGLFDGFGIEGHKVATLLALNSKCKLYFL